MRIKSFFAGTMEAALILARHDMGADAVLVQSRRATPDTRHLGEYEAVCASFTNESSPISDQHSPAGANRSTAGLESVPKGPHGLDRITRDVSDLKRQLERLTISITTSGTGLASVASHPELAEALSRLVAAELDPETAHQVIRKAGQRMEKGSSFLQAISLVREELEQLVHCDPSLGVRGAARHIVALVGPPGAGKTTCLVKLAAQYALAQRRSAQVITTDTYRIAAADQLRSFAAILGIGFQVAGTTLALTQALEEHRQKDLILIDTPGLGKNELQEFGDLSRFLSTHPEVDIHLVAPASMKSADLVRTVEQYEVFRPAKLIFTRLDETDTYGSILSVAVRAARPISFLSGGQRVPEDCWAASPESIIRLLKLSDMHDTFRSNTAAA